MIAYPHAKINLGLNVVAKRDDGFHDLETVFYPIAWCDVMEILPGPLHTKGIEVHLSGIPVQGKHADNLCVRAYELLKKNYSAVRSVKLYLHKQIPMGAGLGGGSSDAAFFIGEINKLFALNIPDEDMRALARQLGSDCAFFISGEPTYAEGRGDEFFPVNVSLSGYYIAVIHPGIHVSTATAFANITTKQPLRNCRDVVLKHHISEWKNLLTNDFEETVFAVHPGIALLKQTMYAHGAIYASMSGSGSAVYGIFREKPERKAFEKYSSCFIAGIP